MNPPSYDGLLVLDKPGGISSRARSGRRTLLDTAPAHAWDTPEHSTRWQLAFWFSVSAPPRARRICSAYAQDISCRTSLGRARDTDDADGGVTPTAMAPAPEAAAVAKGLSGFIGVIEQTPPAYSAAKVAGRRAYDLARQGKDVDLKPRTVQIYGIDLLHYDYPSLKLEIRCGKGTYIRSLARDLGDRLGCGALVQTLRRTRVGPFTVDNAVTLETAAVRALAQLRPMEEAVAELPRLIVTNDEARRLWQGQALRRESLNWAELALFDTAERLVATAKWDAAAQAIRPDKVIRRSESL